jgi:S1-C subfamily serine protease
MLTRLRVAGAVLILLATTGCAQKAPAPQNPASVPTTAASASPAAPRSIDAAIAQQLIAATRRLVVRIETSRCANQESSIGSGFFIDARHVVTVAHVVSQARVGASEGYADIAVRTIDRGVAKAKVIGIDEAADFALLELKEPLANKSGAAGLVLSVQPPKEGDPIVALGYPSGRPLSSFQGHVVGLNQSLTIDDRTLSGLLQYDSSVAAGTSGGPLLLADGTVVGMTESGAKETDTQHAAVTSFGPTIAQWLASPVPQVTPTCPNGVDGLVQSTHAEATGIAKAVAGWLLSAKGYDFLSGRELNRAGSRSQFEAAASGVTRSELVIPPAVSWATETTDSAEVTYKEVTSAGCVLLHKKLVMSTAVGGWTISDAADAEPSKPC